MGLLSFFNKRKDAAPTPTAAAEAVAQARTKARQRLIGAVVLLGVGVIGFPLLFETQPRPIPVNIPIEIPRRESAAPLATPAAPSQANAQGSTQRPRSEVITETDDEPTAAGSASTTKAADASPAKSRAPSTPASAGSPSAGKAAAAVKAPVVPAPSADAKTNASAAAEERFVVQIGAFSESAAARETRAKVEKLGFKTYTQVVETSSGKRIRVRVGPFANREQAAQAADKIKAAGLPSSVLTL